MLKKFIKDLRYEFSGYNASSLSSDLLSGITVTAVALPLALAFGVSSGADAAAGLITAIFAGLIIGFLSGSSFQISGPTGAMSAILISVVATYGIQGMFIATLMAGIILIIAGVFKIGKLVSIIPMPVITGFTSGIAIIIALGQIDNFFGTRQSGESAIAKILSYGDLGFSPHMESVLFGALVILIMIFWPSRLQKYFPSSLLSIVVVLVLNAFLKLDVPTVGAIPRTLLPESRLLFSDLSYSSISGLIVPSISIAALGMIESLLCGATGGRMKGEAFDANRELLAQGIGNLLLPFFGGVPATAAIARTSVAIKSGQRTRLTSIFHSVGLLLSMFLLTGVMSKIPMSALAGVLMVTAWRMNEWHIIKYMTKQRLKGPIAAFLVTMLGTVLFDLSIAIIAGLAISSILFIIKTSDNLEINVSKFNPDRFDKNREFASKETHERIRVIYISGSIFFGNISTLTSVLDNLDEDCSTLIFSLRGHSAMDSTGIYSLLEFCKDSKEKGIDIHFTGVQNSVMRAFKRGGITKHFDETHFHWSTQDILNLVLD